MVKSCTPMIMAVSAMKNHPLIVCTCQLRMNCGEKSWLTTRSEKGEREMIEQVRDGSLELSFPAEFADWSAAGSDARGRRSAPPSSDRRTRNRSS